MNQNQKLISAFIGLILIAFIGFFVFIFNDFNPPERPKEETRNVNSESFRSQTVPTADDKSSILIKVKYFDGAPVQGLNCNLGIMNREGNGDIVNVLNSKISNNNGECLFDRLEPGKNYNIELFSFQNRTFHRTFIFQNLEAGKNQEREISIDKQELESQPAVSASTCTDTDVSNIYTKGFVTYNGQKNSDACDSSGTKLTEYYCIGGGSVSSPTMQSFTANCISGCKDGACVMDVNSIKCIDTDNGKDYFKRGQSSGLTTSQPIGSQNGIIIGQNPNKCSPNMVSNMDRSVNHDCCLDSQTSKQLNEAFCDANGYLSSIGYQCPNGCKDGACIK